MDCTRVQYIMFPRLIQVAIASLLHRNGAIPMAEARGLRAEYSGQACGRYRSSLKRTPGRAGTVRTGLSNEFNVCGDDGKSSWTQVLDARVIEAEISRREPGNPHYSV